MLYREGCIKVNSFDDKSLDVPFWTDYGETLGLNILYNSNYRELVYNRKIIKKCSGGILADEMGLGKTVMLIALILKHMPL